MERTLSNLNAIEIKAFIPSKNFDVSKEFYECIGFTKVSDSGGIAYFHHGNCSFLLQDFYEESLANNLMMHMLVEDIESWYVHVKTACIENKFNIVVSDVIKQPWGMLDFHFHDPSNVLWRLGQNISG